MGSCAPRAAAALAALCLRARLADGAYSRIEGGAKCSDYKIGDIPSKDVCFNTAAPALGLPNATMLQVDGIGFNGCAYNSVSGILIYSVSPAATPDTNTAAPSLEYLCDGIATTTTTATVTQTTVSTTTSTGSFALLEGGTRCWDHSVPDIDTKDVCFNTALHFVGLSGLQTIELNNFGFSGCVYNSVADMLMYGVTPGLAYADNLQQPSFRYLCSGIPTTTSTITTSTATTASSTTASTTSATTTTSKVYTKLWGGFRCAAHRIADVLSKEECFGPAAQAVGLTSKATEELNSSGFSGCLYNAASDTVVFGMDPAVPSDQNPVQTAWRYICIGTVKSLFPFPLFP